MQKKNALFSRRLLALDIQGCFFSLAFWTTVGLLSLFVLLRLNSPSPIHANSVHRIISFTPSSQITITDSPNCSEDSRLLFNFVLPGFTESSCYRQLEDGSGLDVRNGWYRCKSLFFKGYKAFSSTSDQQLVGLNQSFVCAKKFDLQLSEFEYLEKSAEVAGLQSPVKPILGII